MVGGNVKLVAALVGKKQIVTLCSAHRALDHAFVLANPVVVVHDVIARLEILEYRHGLTAARSWSAMRATTSRQVGLGNNCEFDLWERKTVVEWCDHHGYSRAAEIG